jgi:hypothetical protein
MQIAPMQQQTMTMGMPVMQQAPIDPNASESVLTPFPNLLIKQTRKGCLQELLGCEANTEFKIATHEQPNNDFFYATENTSCCIRFFCGASRPFEITMHYGQNAQGPLVAKYERPFRCMLGNCKCCCFQTIIATNQNNKNLGAVTEGCWMCVPSFNVTRPDGAVQYKIHMPTCCGGMCVDVCAEGCCNCRIPFYIYDANNDVPKQEVGKIKIVRFGEGGERSC